MRTLIVKEKLNRTKGTKGSLFWKQRWFSICSMHYKYKEDCHICNTGGWTNVWQWKIGSLIYKLTPNLWKWWMNRPNSKARRQIMEWFPKLKN